jgi:hypothetical protein
VQTHTGRVVISQAHLFPIKTETKTKNYQNKLLECLEVMSQDRNSKLFRLQKWKCRRQDDKELRQDDKRTTVNLLVETGRELHS